VQPLHLLRRGRAACHCADGRRALLEFNVSRPIRWQAVSRSSSRRRACWVCWRTVRPCQAAHCVIPSTRSFPCTPKIHRSRTTGHKGITPASNIYSSKCYILYVAGPTCRGSVPLCMPPFSYKRGGMRRYKADLGSDSQYITQWSRVLRPGGSNHSKPSCAVVCSSTNLVTSRTLRPLLILGIRAGAIFHTAGEIYPPTFGAPGRGLGLKFLLVPSLSMMVRIIEHRVETSEDLAMEQEVVSSAPRVPDRPEPRAAVVHVVQQHTPVQVSRTPSRATPTTLSVARELLRHPYSSRASPGAMKQWRDDVDRLLGMVHSTSTRSKPGHPGANVKPRRLCARLL
jgi:hypothetical protein